MKKYRVYGTIMANINFSVVVKAPSEIKAVIKAEKIVYKSSKIIDDNVIKDEIYADEIK